jgi:hypothetical protein
MNKIKHLQSAAQPRSGLNQPIHEARVSRPTAGNFLILLVG